MFLDKNFANWFISRSDCPNISTSYNNKTAKLSTAFPDLQLLPDFYLIPDITEFPDFLDFPGKWSPYAVDRNISRTPFYQCCHKHKLNHVTTHKVCRYERNCNRAVFFTPHLHNLNTDSLTLHCIFE